MIEPRHKHALGGLPDWAGRVWGGVFDGLVNGMVGAALVGERLRRIVDRRCSSRRFAGTPCSRLPRPHADDGGDVEGRSP